MSDFKQIYAHHAPKYDRLVACEDAAGQIATAVAQIRPLADCVVAEWGAGTGRLTTLLAPLARQWTAFDRSAAMLAVAQQKPNADRWQTAVADHQQIPLPSHSADVAIEGWAFAHYVGWFADSWQPQIDRALAEMRRVLRPGGRLILFETLGTGYETPTPPDHLRPLYRYLQEQHQLQHRWIRTDYQFADLAEAVDLLGFFFGPEMAAQAVARGQADFPECTGIWFGTAVN